MGTSLSLESIPDIIAITMREYELTVLFRADLAEKELDKEVKDLVGLLEKAGAKIAKKVDAVKKSLAYEIAKVREAYYVYCELEVDPAKLSGLGAKLKLDENLLRYLLVRKD